MHAQLRKLFVCFLSLIMALTLTFGPLGASPARAISYVSNLNDSGPGSLRQAIADAAPGDTIYFQYALGGGTIHLASTLTIGKNLWINADTVPNSITLSGDTDNDTDGDVRVMIVSPGVTLTLRKINIFQGKATDGGGIVNNGELTLLSTVLVANSATSFRGGAINNNGQLDIHDSTFAYNSAVTSGGAISNVGSGTLHIERSLFIFNSAREGGAISNSRPLTVINSTFAANTATLYGGGAINNSNTLTIRNATLFDNYAVTGGGGISNYGGGTLNYANTIIAGSYGGDCFNNSTIGTNTGNLVEDGSCSAALNGDPMLDALSGNGGPTDTSALLPGSPARDAGDDAICETWDQRGALRPQGAHCDIGAYEAADSLVVTNANYSGAGSLRDAVSAAAAYDTITFDAALSGATIRLATELPIDKPLTIDGSALASSIILSGDYDNDGSGDTRVMHVTSGGIVILDSLTITKGYWNYAAGILNEGTLHIFNSALVGNHAWLHGGAIYSVAVADTYISNSTIQGNVADWSGGGVVGADGSYTQITNSTISDNAGGGIIITSGGTFLYSNTIIANSTAGSDCTNNGTLDPFSSFNLVEDGSCSASLSGDPALGPLADNGGPTQTMALQAGSPAIDAGNNLICANPEINNLDQRGQARPVGAQCDIGAFEAQRLPVDGATLHTKRPSFDWADIPGATGYQIQVATNPAFKMPKISASLNGAANSQYASTKDLAASAGHFWRVRAKLPGFNKYGPWSPAFIFFTGNPPGVPALTAPASNALLTNLSPTLDWNDSSVPDGTFLDHYQVQMSNSADFSSLIMNQDSAVSNLDIGPLNPNTTYYWRVRSWNTGGDYSGWSVARSFREAMLPPTLLSPIGNTLVGSLKPAFDWSSVIGATKYNIQISLSNTFSPLTVNASVAASQYTVTVNLKAGKLYYWRVRSIGPNGPSLWSAVENFLTP